VPFRDHFSKRAADYARFRPDYPAALFDWLAGVAPRRRMAWDCACGSGQATTPLAARFERVVATDASVMQLRKLPLLGNAVIAAGAAERVPMATATVDLVAVAQALHWFDLEAFWDEVRRVLRPGGVFAAWTYGLPEMGEPEIERVIRNFVTDTLGPWWPPEIVHVLEGYAGLDLPFAEIESPPFEMIALWTLPRLLDFVRTWSGVTRFLAATGRDPVEDLNGTLEGRWGPPEVRRAVRWRLKVRAGTV
jgi:SAM-dependent methyltransferase